MKEHKENRKVEARKEALVSARRLCLFSFFILPYLLIYLSPLPEALSRILSILLFYFLTTFGALWWSLLSPSSDVISPEGKLHRVASPTIVKRVEWLLRILGILLGCILLWQTVLLVLDVKEIAQGTPPAQVTGIVKTKGSPLFGLWCLLQHINVSSEGKEQEDVHLFYSFEPVHRGERVDLWVLPRTRAVIQRVH